MTMSFLDFSIFALGLERVHSSFIFLDVMETCEGWPNPLQKSRASARITLFSFDGPGQAQSNLRGFGLLLTITSGLPPQRSTPNSTPEIDDNAIVGFGGGMGSFYALRHAAYDDRVKAVATKSSYADKYYLMDEEGPRWKRLYAYITQATTEDELDEIMSAMTLHGKIHGRIKCPTFHGNRRIRPSLIR